MIEQRKSGVRRDINDLFRDESGKISGTKIGTYAGQYISGHLLITNSTDVIDHWDSLAVLFLVLIAPEAYKKFLAMKMGGSFTERTTEHVEHTKTEVKKEG